MVQHSANLDRPSNTANWDRIVKVTCPTNCNYQRFCVLNAFIKDDRIVRVEQTANYPLSNDSNVPDWNPRGCQKGLAYAGHMYDPTRALHPLKRVGPRGAGQWERLTWDEALSEIADKLIDVLVSEGPESILAWVGNIRGSELISLDAVFRRLGVAMQSGAAETGDEHQGAAQVFGQAMSGCSSDNMFHADVLLIWGGNPAYTSVNQYHFITEARYNGTKVITISPDFSPSAVHADLWVPVNIGTDAALALSVAQVMIAEGLHKPDFLREQTDLPFLVRKDNRRYLREKDIKRGGREDIFYVWDSSTNKPMQARQDSLALEGRSPALEGEFEVSTFSGKVKVTTVFELLRNKLNAESTPEKASLVTGVPGDVIRRFAREIGTAKGVVNISTYNWGKFYHGDLIERSIILVFALGGHIGRKGACYNAFPFIGVDAILTGLDVTGTMMLQTAAAGDPRFAQWQLEGYTDEMIMLQYARELYKGGSVSSSSYMAYLHAGLLELSDQHNSWDPTLKRPLMEYVKEAWQKKWQPVVPPRGKTPRALFAMGASPIRRARATDVVLKTLWPKLNLVVAIDVRMSSLDMYADYVLPAAGWWEKYSVGATVQPEFPYGYLVNKAVEPLGEAKNEWEIGCLLAKKLQERAEARGITSFADGKGTVRPLDNLYERVTGNGMYLEEDEEAVARDYLSNATNLAQVPWEDVKATGMVPCTGVGKSPWSIGNACDVTPGEPFVSFADHVDKKQPWPTLTRRAQFYIDHEWYFELGQELPAQLEDPKAGGDYPLRLTGGHARWSIHSNHIDDPVLLRLQRGEPCIFISKRDAEVRGIQDGDRVEVFNDVGSFMVLAAVSSAARPGQVIMYHAWEHFQFPDKQNFKSVMASPLNPIELVGDYGHIAPTPGVFYPGYSDRETRVDARKV